MCGEDWMQNPEKNHTDTITLVGKLYGGKHISLQDFADEVHRCWQIKGETKIEVISKGLYKMVFAKVEEYQHVKQNGPWVIQGFILSIKKGDDLGILGEDRRFDRVDFWVQIFGLPRDRINEKNVHTVGSTLDKVKGMDLHCSLAFKHPVARIPARNRNSPGKKLWKGHGIWSPPLKDAQVVASVAVRSKGTEVITEGLTEHRTDTSVWMITESVTVGVARLGNASNRGLDLDMTELEKAHDSGAKAGTLDSDLRPAESFTFVIRKLSDKKKYHPCAGTVLNHVLHFRKLHHYMTDLARKHKTYRLISPFRNEIYTSDPANVEYILKTNFPNYGKGWYNYTILNDLMGDGIVTVDGERWKYQRKVSSYEFSTKNLRDFSVAVFRRNAEKLAGVVSDAAAENKPFDVQHLFLKSTMDTIFKVGFGVELDSVFGAQEGAKFAHAFTESSEIIMWRYADMLWRMKRFFSVGTEARLKKDVKVKKEDLLSRFLELNATDPKYLRDITFNFLHAGRDTTAATLTWFMYRMCMHPHIQEKVAQEVKEAAQLKDTTSISEFAATVTEDHVLDKMQYLHAALSETLRLHPAVPVDGKICFSDDTLPDGYSVKKGDMIAYQPYAMGRMKYNWGEDAEEYRPERWIDEDGKFRPESPFKFTTFQAGPRICTGKDFAYREMKIWASVLFNFFVFKLEDETKPVKYKTMLNLHIDGALNVQAFPRAGRNLGKIDA
ncbi:hypothetical protein IFM89_038001 [Coptis chinensis]|uniref:DUF4283 domain-containing protein n=1 Tax=Coptis chinensis TaxID=261450 RepID=A0A835M0Q4_9MAGN|nr:hypothetical protein IFM89_038001 [Coptis chinensis]